MRFGAVFIAVCMALIAGSAGAAAHLGLGLSATQSIIVALAVLTGLGVYNSLSIRTGVRVVVDSQLDDLSRSNADIARQLGEVGRRLAAIETRVDTVQNRTRAATDPLAAELGELGSLIRQLADTVASHETRLGEMARLPREEPGPAVAAPPAEAPAASATLPVVDESEVEERQIEEPRVEDHQEAVDSDADRLAAIRAAVDDNRVDLYLQPIVTLPQRKVRYYEGLSRLRTDSGEIWPASDFVALAERADLMGRIDNLAVLRCVQIVRRLTLRNREVGVFCNISAATLSDAVMFQQLLEFLDANRAIAPSVVLEMTHGLLRSAGPIENEALSALADRGFRFSLDNLVDLRIEPRDLAARGFRYVKVPADLLLHPNDAAGDIHPADLSDLLGRFGIDLIAEKIENESVVVNLLDYDVRFGQGYLFSPPRPVRAEALQGVAERGDPVAREPVSREPVPADEAPVARAPAAEPAANGTGRLAATGRARLARPVSRI
jgi:cyclic-di-GMP phosphodiesterase TipF (flagellum assembly factor)